MIIVVVVNTNYFTAVITTNYFYNAKHALFQINMIVVKKCPAKIIIVVIYMKIGIKMMAHIAIIIDSISEIPIKAFERKGTYNNQS